MVPAQNNLNALPALDSIVTTDAVESDKLKATNYQEEYQKQVELFQEKNQKLGKIRFRVPPTRRKKWN